ncbi:MAG: efflux RND transporter periplasmic adaptor subunit [Gemmatimonadales bacterium]
MQTALSFPALRRDLAVSRQETPDGTVLVIKDPESRRFFRLGPVECFIAQQFDGTRSLADVRRIAEQHYDTPLDDGVLRTFVGKLDAGGLLESNKPRAPRKPDRRRVRGNLLYLRLPLFDPDKLMTWLEREVRFLYSAPALKVGAVLIAAALMVTAANGPQIARDLLNLYALAVVPFVILLALIVVSAHEFAHGVTCKHFGGEVHEVGFMLVYFQPFFYCNVSDAWLFPEKAKRLWVGFAGLYFEFVVWALATLMWAITESGTWVSYAALTVMAISGLKSVFDLNPFIKLDGYYILSDWLDIPNLRRRAFRYVGDGIRRVLGLGDGAAASVTPRERNVLLGYGLIATVSSFVLLAVGLQKAGSVLLDHHQAAALILLVGYAAMRLARRLKRLFMRPRTTAAHSTSVAAPAAPAAVAAPAEKASSKAPPSRRRWRGAWTRRLLWFAVAAGAVTYTLIGRTVLRVSGPFTVLPEHNADVRSEVEGIIQTVMVDENSRVRAGDVIARLSDKDLRAELAKTEASIRETTATLRKQEAGPTDDEISLAKADVAKTDDAAKFAAGKVSRLKSIHDLHMMSDQEYDDAQSQALAATHDHAAAADRLAVLLHGTRTEDLDATRAQIDGLETQRHLTEMQLHMLDVRSPSTGVIATPSRELHALRGQHVNKGDLIAKVYEVRTVTAQISVAEKELADVRPGEAVLLRSRAYPNEVFRGTISAIATAAEGMSSNTSEVSGSKSPAATPVAGNTFSVTTEIENDAGLLKPGMTGMAKITVGERRIRDVIARRLARTFKVELWSWW